MSSSLLACVGLAAADATELDALLTRALDDSLVVGRPGNVETRRWWDESGVTLTVVRRREQVLDLVPCFAGQVGADLADLRPFGDHVQADVRDGGVTVTRIACALPQAPYLPRIPIDLTPAAVVALGVDVSVHADAEAFEASDASRLGAAAQDVEVDADADADIQGEDGVEEARFGAESLLPYGLFGDPDEAAPTAFVAGTVLLSETHTNSLTGQVFHVMLLRTLGMTVTLCLAADEHPEAPAKGAVVAGTCYLIADLPSLWKVQPKPRRAWLRSRR